MVSDRIPGFAAVLAISMLSPLLMNQAFAIPLARDGTKAVTADAPTIKQRPPKAGIVLMIFQRIRSVGEHLIKMQEVVLFRIKKKKPVNPSRIKARLLSAKNQIRSLYMKAARFESMLNSADPKLPEIQSEKRGISELKTEFEANCGRIGQAAGGSGPSSPLSDLASCSADFFDPPTAISSSAYPLQTLDEQF